MALSNPEVLAQLIGFGLFLWLGLYLLVRATSNHWLIGISVAGLFSMAAYFGSNVPSYTSTDPEVVRVLERWFWWTAVTPAAAWFHFSTIICRGISQQGAGRPPPLFPPLVVVIYTTAALIIVVGSFSNLFVDFSSPAVGPGGNAMMLTGPFYTLYIAYIAIASLGALINFIRALRELPSEPGSSTRAARQQLRLLAVGALTFSIGALWIASRYHWLIPIPALPGFLCLLVGLAAFGVGIAYFGMLLEGKRIQRDFLYSLTGLLLMNVLYIGLIAAGGDLSPMLLLSIVGLVTLTHTAFDNGRKVMDHFFFSYAERTARAEARDYATVLGTSPVAAPAFAGPGGAVEDPQDEGDEASLDLAPVEQPQDTLDRTSRGIPPKQFKDEVRRAITSLKSPPRLAQNPLLSLPLIEWRLEQQGLKDNRLNRAAVLRELLIEQIGALRPSDGTSSFVGDAWRFYNVLYYPYLRELSRKGALAEVRRLAEERRRQGVREPSELEQVLSWLADIDEDTFYKWQRRASDTIAMLLWEENEQVRQEALITIPARQYTQQSRRRV